ncbi:MAG TPA: 2'-5' RNA ligase family protein [Gemmatimonadaceae bacterium]|nr:2'-5' RNA ligase family protein [Gemmatimonadaceae bacterium]
MNGIFIVSELTGAARERVHAIQRKFDPKLARGTPPHITIAGSSGVGPLPVASKVPRVRELLEPIARATPPITVRFERPHRYMQTEIIVLPIDPHGPIRELHEAIRSSGLRFERSRFPFSPHCTLSFYRTLTPESRRGLMAVRVDEPVVIDRLQFYLTLDLVASRKVLELELGGE